MRRVFFGLVCLTALAASPSWRVVSADEQSLAVSQSPNLPPPLERTVDYARDVQPLLRAACYSCHGPEAQEAGLRLDLKRRAREGGDGGAVIVPGDSAASRLIQIVAGLNEDLGLMPPEGEGTPLTAEQIGLLRAWIDQGAPWPDDADNAATRITHWSFQPITRPKVPIVVDALVVDALRAPSPDSRSESDAHHDEVHHDGRGRASASAIDAFVLARLEREGFAPAPPADKATLLRRVSLDLVGLPPSPEEMAAFLADDSPDAYERVVDRLLASPHYGERWGRHWLDLARYADSDGYEKDKPRPYAWRYRQWVIDALNEDMPFDRFTIAQIAGDLLPDATPQDRIATGFHRNTLHNTEGGIDPEEDRVKKTVDRTNTVSTVWLGLTMGCAQCHSHKYDPITQREYFSMYAFFNNLDEVNWELPATKGGKAQVVAERSEPRQTRIHARGDFLSPGEVVTRATPAVLPPLEECGEKAESRGDGTSETADRLDLARWIMAPENPLTARVAANRIWQRLFGQGLVRTPDDFGMQGEPPSHPELLDWLACELRDGGWSQKRLVRRIVTSDTYRQSSRVVDRPSPIASSKTSNPQTPVSQTPDPRTLDPENVLLWRQNRLRVEAEIVRDLALAVSGLWDSRIGGRSVRPVQPPDRAMLTYANSAKWEVSAGGDAYRRGLYTFFQRTSPYPMFMTFDSPDSNECCAQRELSNTPLQALTLWNDAAFYECAQGVGRRIVAETPAGAGAEETVRRRVEYAFQLCLARGPDAFERSAVEELYRAQRALCQQDAKAAAAIAGDQPAPSVDAAELAAWVIVGRTLMNLDEFITRE